jgi:hypothetical protein
VSDAFGVGSSRASSGSDGPPPCVLWVQFFASEAVGVGSNRSRSNSEGPPCWLAAEMPLEEPSCAVGVGSISACASAGTGAGPGAQEHALAAVCRADVGGADATPERVIPRFGQVAEYAEYTVQTSLAPAKRGDVLHDEQRRS